MACASCRKRNLKCDRGQPACSDCTRANEVCSYVDNPPRPQSKRKRLDFEEYLVAYDRQTDGALQNPNSFDRLSAIDTFALYHNFNSSRDPPADVSPDESDSPETPFSNSFGDNFLQAAEESPFVKPVSPKHEQHLEMVGLQPIGTGLSEDIKTELTGLFFDDVYPNIPIIHRTRYYASLDLAPEQQPPLCLRYAMWALTAVQNAKWSYLANTCYEKAKTYLEQDETRAAGTEILNVAHVQCWSLIATYESYMFLSLRTWSSIRRAAALAQVLRLHTIDESNQPVTPLLPEAQDVSEVEERRRAFWSAFSNDRWVSSRTGYPMTISEREITTKLPGSERSFNTGLIETTQSLDDALEAGLDEKTSLCGARAVLACILGRVMRHIGSATSTTKVYRSQQFWSQHKELDDLLTKVSSTRSAELRPLDSSEDLKLWALEMWLHGLNICLHQTAMDFAAKENKREETSESRKRCRIAAAQIIRITRSIAHMETKKMDPFTASCVYMAATVLIQDRTRGQSHHTDLDDLRLLERALEAMQKHWKVTEMFVTQFKEDLAKGGISLLITPREEDSSHPRKRRGYFSLSGSRFSESSDFDKIPST